MALSLFSRNEGPSVINEKTVSRTFIQGEIVNPIANLSQKLRQMIAIRRTSEHEEGYKTLEKLSSEVMSIQKSNVSKKIIGETEVEKDSVSYHSGSHR